MNNTQLRRHRYGLFLDDSLRRATSLGYRRHTYRLPVAEATGRSQQTRADGPDIRGRQSDAGIG